jgi:dihydropyrimidinase
VLDPADKRVIRAQDLHEADYTPWEGRKMDAWPSLTILRGKAVVESGTWKGSNADGKWQHRKIAEEMFAGPQL